MHKLLLALVAVFVFYGTASAQYVKVLGVAGQSAVVTTSGTSSTTKAYRTFPQSTVTVYYTGTTNLIPLFATSAGSVLANPFTADTLANFGFYVPPGTIMDIRFSGTGIGTPFTLSAITAPGGSQGATVMACAGTADTAILTTANSAGGPIIIPKGITCASNSQTLSSYLDVQYGGLLKPITGQTITLTGPQNDGAWQKFTNATAGLGTVSFSGNKVVREVFVEWWGGAPSATATTTTAAFNAANVALVTIGAGDIVMGGSGTYLTNGSGIVIGNNSVGVFTGIGLRGTNGAVGSKISYSGTGDAITLTNGRYNRLTDFTLIQSGSKGTSRGIVLTGPGGGGAFTFFSEVERVTVSNFHIGIENGNTTSGFDADLVDFKHVSLEGNNIGLKVTGANSTMIHAWDVNVGRSAIYGVYLNAQGGTNINWYGGSFGGNAISFYNNSSATNYNIQGVRDEWRNGGVTLDYQFIRNEVNYGTIRVANCMIVGDGSSIPTYPIISNNGGVVEIIDSSFGSFTEHFIPFGPSTGSAQVSSSTLTMRGNTVNENVVLFSSNSSCFGMVYLLENNNKMSDAGVQTKWDDEVGIIGAGGVRNGKITVNTLTSAAVNAALARLDSGEIHLLPATYAVSSPITKTFTTTPSKLIITGDGPASVLNWTGSAGSPMLKLVNPNGVVLRDLTLTGKSAAKPSAAINLNQQSGIPIHAVSLENIRIGGGSDSGKQFTHGILLDGIAANNSEIYGSNIDIANGSGDGIHIGNIQSINIHFTGLNVNGYTNGVWSAGTITGTSWNFNGCTNDFYLPATDDLGSPTDPMISVYGYHSENGVRLSLLSSGRLTIEHGTYAMSTLSPANGKIVDASSVGPLYPQVNLTLRDFKFAQLSAPPTAPFLDFSGEAGHGGSKSIVLDGVAKSVLTGGTNGLKVLTGDVTDVRYVYYREMTTPGVNTVPVVAQNFINTNGAEWSQSRFDIKNPLAQGEGAALTVSSNTVTPTNSIHQVGAGLIKTIVVPAGFISGTIQFVPTAAFTYDATGNILGTGTAVVGRTMSSTYSASTSKWSMSY